MKMKKALALALALSMTLGSFGFASANPTTVAADAPAGLERIVENGYFGVSGLRLQDEAKREEFTAIILRLSGISDAEVQALKEKANFSDVPVNDYMAPWIGKAVKEGLFMGDTGATTFRPKDSVNYTEMLVVLMRALGYTAADFQGLSWPSGYVAKAMEVGLEVDLGVDPLSVVKRETVAFAMEQALDTVVKGGEHTLAQHLGIEEVEAPVETLEVADVKANTAKSFLVKFNRAVTEEDAVTFAVKRLSTSVAVTTTWNEDMTEATLTSATNFAEATFAVEVLADAKSIATENVTISAQKVKKVEFTSKNVSVNLSTGVGFVTYKVYDQYDNDITNHYLANNMTFQSGAVSGTGSVVGRNGLITLTPAQGGNPLIQFPNISVVVFDTTSGVSATATLPTASAIGTLSSFELGSVENVELVENDVTSVHYIPFTAKDMSGNDTKDYDLITGGMIFNAANTTDLVVSLPGYVSAKIVRDPNNARHAAVEVKALTNNTDLAMDMPVTITAMTYAGTSSSVQTNIVKAKVLNSITLLAPAETVAINESPEIKFEAYDQFGNRITRHADIVGKISPTGITLEKKVDGTAKFVMNSVGNKGLTQLSVVVSATGKMSTVNINVQDAAKPSRIAIDSSKIVTAMEHGADQKINFNGQTPGGITVYDQYDRVLSTTKVNNLFNSGNAYRIDATNQSGAVGLGTTTGSAITLNSASDLKLVANAATGGSDTIKFELIDVAANKAISTGAVSVSVIKTADIVDYTINTFEKAIYAAGTGTDKKDAYAAEVEVYGKTRSGAKVLLAGTPVISTSVENDANFTVLTAAGAWDAVKVAANALPANKTAENTVVTVNLHHNNKVTALTTNLTSSSVAPVATTIATRSTTEDKITLTKAQFDALTTKSFAMYNAAGAETTRANAFFRVTDSYGTYAMIPANFVVEVTGTSTLTLSADGTVTAANGVANDVVRVTAITNNGLMKTIEIKITN